MIVFPNAKINIGLHITGRRNDGYHTIETVFYPVRIKDVVEVIEADQTELSVSGLVIPGSSQNNLCLKAYQLIAADFKLPPVHIHIHKHIPIGAGLGGGSSDAAFFISLLNDKFQLGITGNEMDNYARRLGADCAFFLRNKPACAFGKGDEFEDLVLDLSPYHIVLVMPPVHVSTAEAYAGVKPKQPELSLKELIKLDITDWKNFIKNDFEETVFARQPRIGEVKSMLYDKGAVYAAMSGSGASVYGIFNQRPDLSLPGDDTLVFYDV